MYPSPAKMKKQFQYANNTGIPFVVVQGSDEAARGTVTLKNMAQGSQEELSPLEAIGRVTKWVTSDGAL